MPSIQPVVMVLRGYGTDTVLFACGHASVIDPHKGRKPYPRRRRCIHCVSGDAPVPVDREKFMLHERRTPEVLIPEEA